METNNRHWNRACSGPQKQRRRIFLTAWQYTALKWVIYLYTDAQLACIEAPEKIRIAAWQHEMGQIVPQKATFRTRSSGFVKSVHGEEFDDPVMHGIA